VPLPDQDKAFLTEQFAAMESAVKVDYFHQSPTSVEVPGRQPCLSCEATKEVLEELAGLSDQITLTTYELADEEELANRHGIEQAPGIVVRGEKNRPLRLTGMPGGVFLALVMQAILSMGGQPLDPSGQLKSTLKKLRNPTDIRVVGAMMDPATGDAAIAALALALVSDKVEVWVYNLDEFPILGANMNLNLVPATVVGGRYGFAGATTAPELARYLYDLEARPDQANLKPPTVASGSAHPWAPPGQQPPQPQPPPGSGPSGPGSGPPGPGRGPGAPPPSGGAPAGMHRTESGLIVPNS